MMKLYFSPLACSLATRIAVLEAGLTAEFVEVDPKTKRTSSDADYKAINPLGLVPALQLEDGSLLTENAAVLQYVGALAAERGGADLAPRPLIDRARLQKWLSFVGTELHKAVYVPLLTADAPDGAKAFALSRADARLSYVAAHLTDREFLLDRFSVADAYLFAVLNWTQVTPIDLLRWPPLTAYVKRLLSRDAVARAVAEERALYVLEQARHAGQRRLSTRAVIDRFNEVFQRHDPGPLDGIVADDCVVENTQPAPDGSRHVGKAACVALWRDIATDPGISFDLEDVQTQDDRAVIYWRLRHQTGSVRGVNLVLVRDGRIVEARGYIKTA